MAPCCLVFLFVPWVFVEFPVLKETSSFHLDFLVFGTNSLCAFALNLAVFLLVGKTSALTMNVAGVVKDWLLIAFSVVSLSQLIEAVSSFGKIYCASMRNVPNGLDCCDVIFEVNINLFESRIYLIFA